MKNETINAIELYKNSSKGAAGFFPWEEWPLSAMNMIGNDASVSWPSPIEDGRTIQYADNVPKFWKYDDGVPNKQTWRKPNPSQDLMVRVNGREEFWNPPHFPNIPGGTSYENIEMKESFR